MSGSRGRLSMPDNVRELRGNPGKRSTPPSTQNQFVSAIPTPPTNLTAEAKAEWKRITPELGRTKVIAAGDRALLATYCETWASIHHLQKGKRAALKAIAELADPMAILEGWGKVTQIEAAINAKVRLMLPMQQQLLLTPVSRLRTPPPKNDQPTSEDLD